MPEDAFDGESGKERWLSDRGNGMSRRVCGWGRHEYSSGERRAGCPKVCEGFHKTTSAERIFGDSASITNSSKGRNGKTVSSFFEKGVVF